MIEQLCYAFLRPCSERQTERIVFDRDSDLFSTSRSDDRNNLPQHERGSLEKRTTLTKADGRKPTGGEVGFCMGSPQTPQKLATPVSMGIHVIHFCINIHPILNRFDRLLSERRNVSHMCHPSQLEAPIDRTDNPFRLSYPMPRRRTPTRDALSIATAKIPEIDCALRLDRHLTLPRWCGAARLLVIWLHGWRADYSNSIVAHGNKSDSSIEGA